MRRGSSRPDVAVVGAIAPGGMATSVARGFAMAGASCEMVPYPRVAPRLSRLGFRGAGGIDMVALAAIRPGNEALLVAELARLRPRLVLFLKCDDLHGPTYAAIRRATGATLGAFHPDDPFNGRASAWQLRGAPSHRRAIAQLRAVDHTFTWSHALVRRTREAGARVVHYLPFACDPVMHPRARRGDVPADLISRVAFIGNWDAERERWLTPLASTDVGLTVWGDRGWQRNCRSEALKRCWRGRPLFREELAQATIGADINLNILRTQNKGACNMRTFEIPCMGGFMLHERSPEAAAIFPPGEACADFADPEELVAQVSRYAERPDARARIAERGYAVAMANTYTDWARRVLSAVA